jgi:serine O-acetyltransferase
MSEETDRADEDPIGLWQLLVEDWRTHHRRFMLPGFHAVAVHRIGVWARGQVWPVRKGVGLLYTAVATLLIRGVYGVELPRTTVVGRRVCIGHHQGVVIGTSVVIGDDCLIRQGLTLGQTADADGPMGQPVVGNGVHFGAGATVIGSVRIGDGARIGPGAIVTTNIPPGATAFAAPARVMRTPSAA